MRTLKETARGPRWQRLHLYLLAQTTVHVSENCGRWSGYHDDGLPMICNRRAGHVGRSHYDSVNGLIWRSGEEPRATEGFTFTYDEEVPDLVIVDDPPGRPGQWITTAFLDDWRARMQDFGAVLALEVHFTDATHRSADAFVMPGWNDTPRTFDGRPIIDGARPGLIFYTTDPGATP